MSTPVKPTRPVVSEEEKRARTAEDEYMSDASTETSASEEGSEYSESDEEEDIIFNFSLSHSSSRRILKKGDCVNNFAIDVIAEAAKLGAEIRKKNDSIRVVGKKYTLKFTCEEEDGSDLIAEAFEEITGTNDASDEAALLAFFVSSADDDSK